MRTPGQQTAWRRLQYLLITYLYYLPGRQSAFRHAARRGLGVGPGMDARPNECFLVLVRPASSSPKDGSFARLAVRAPHEDSGAAVSRESGRLGVEPGGRRGWS